MELLPLERALNETLDFARTKKELRNFFLQNIPAYVTTLDAVRETDMRGQVALLVDAQFWVYDPEDTTSPDDGIFVLVDAKGHRYKFVPSAALEETEAATAANAALAIAAASDAETAQAAAEQSQLAAELAASSGLVVRETKAEIDALLSDEDYDLVQTAEVTDDGNNTGRYARESNVWVKRSERTIDGVGVVAEETAAATVGIGTGLRRGQIIGIAGEISDGTTTIDIASNHYCVFQEPIAGDGLITTIRAYAGGTGAWNFAIFEKVGTKWIFVKVFQQTIGASGYVEIPVTVEVFAGQYIGVSDNNGNLRAISGSFQTGAQSDSGGYIVAASAGTTDVGANPTRTVNLRVGFDILFWPNEARHQRSIIDIQSSDKIVLLGTSYTADEYTMRKKSWLQRINDFGDWRLENFAYGGASASDNLSYIRARSYNFGPVTFMDYGATYGILRHGENDGSFSFETYLTVLDTMQSVGCIPIVATEHRETWGDITIPQLHSLAAARSAFFIDGIEHTQNVDPTDGGYGTRDPRFWLSDYTTTFHYGVRTNDVSAYPVEAFIAENLDEPQESIRIFRHRPDKDGVAIAVSDIADLRYQDNYTRHVIWEEIDSGHWALRDNTTGMEVLPPEVFYDEMDTLLATTYETITSEYLKLQAGAGIAMPDYSLVECILDAVGKNVASVSLRVSDPDVTVYVLDAIYHLSGYPTITTAAGVWRPVPLVGGLATVNGADLSGKIFASKMKFLLYKSGGWTMYTPAVIYDAKQGKPRRPRKPPRVSNSSPEMISNPFLVDSGALAADWDSEGTVTFGTGLGGTDLPRGATGHAVISDGDMVAQTIAFAADAERDREFEIEVYAMTPKDIYDSSGTFPDDAPITHNSVDFGQIIIDVFFGGELASYRHHVPLYWRPIRVRSFINRSRTGLKIRVRSATTGELWVAKVSARLVV